MLFGEFMLKIVSYFVIWFMNHCNIVVRPTNWWTEEPDISWEVSSVNRGEHLGNLIRDWGSMNRLVGGIHRLIRQTPAQRLICGRPLGCLYHTDYGVYGYRPRIKTPTEMREYWTVEELNNRLQTDGANWQSLGSVGWACLLVCVRLSPWAGLSLLTELGNDLVCCPITLARLNIQVTALCIYNETKEELRQGINFKEYMNVRQSVSVLCPWSINP